MVDQKYLGTKGWNDGLRAAEEFFRQTPVDMVGDLGDAYDLAFEQLPETETTYTDREYNFAFVEGFVGYWREHTRAEILDEDDITLDDIP